MPLSPPRPRFPPLNALRAFEAAARHGGFAQAAEELSVTPAAISQHIKALEAWAGVPLFERRSQGVRLTPAARRIAPAFTRAFDSLGAAVSVLRDEAPAGDFAIAALPSVAQLWLPPRLPALRAALGSSRLSIYALETPPHLDRGMFDLSLFIRHPTEVGTCRRLDGDEIFPACAPAIAARLTSPADLEAETLLFDESWQDDWPLWARAAGWRSVVPPQGPRYSLYSLVLEEARAGAGVMMAHHALVAPDLASGRLVRPFGPDVATGKALMMEMRPGDPRAEAVARALSAGHG